MSKWNRERRRLWKLGLTKKQTGQRLSGKALTEAIEKKLAKKDTPAESQTKGG